MNILLKYFDVRVCVMFIRTLSPLQCTTTCSAFILNSINILCSALLYYCHIQSVIPISGTNFHTVALSVIHIDR